jgi:gamma-glutamylcyclotransferase (GGCT)/AIG2-like uncharacterized protein YtfP
MSTQQPSYLFVYGTLRTSIEIPVKEQIRGHVELIGEAEIKGKLYDMGGYPAAVPAGDGVIKGEVLKITDAEKVFGALDTYEGYNYQRRQQEVTLPDGEKISAWVYWYVQSVEGKPTIEEKDYLEYLKQNKRVY